MKKSIITEFQEKNTQITKGTSQLETHFANQELNTAQKLGYQIGVHFKKCLIIQ